MMSQTQLEKRERIPELNLVRCMAILGVLTVHSSSFATLNMIDSGMYGVYNFFNIFMKFGTPTFIFLSSFVLFYNYYTRPLDKQLVTGFYKKRLLYILIPYFMFSLFYFGILHVTHYPDRSFVDTITSFTEKLLTGKAYTHLYFVFINMQFYILFPLVLWLFKKAPSLVKWAVPIGLAIQWGFIVMNKYGVISVANKGSWSPSYFAYFMLGAFLGVYFPKIKQWIVMKKEHATPAKITTWIALWAVWLGAGIAHAQIWYLNRKGIAVYDSLWYEFLWNLHTFAAALVLFQIAFLLYKRERGQNAIVRGMSRIGGLSFGIYLIHPFFLLIYREFPPQTGISMLHHLWYVGGFLVALIGSYIVVSLASRIPQSWILFGNLPKPKKKERAIGEKRDLPA